MEEIEALLETGAVAAVEIAASALAERGAAPVICPNCNKPLIGPYCAVCGQPHNTHRRSIGHLLHDFFKDIVSFDSRILRTARALLIQPGELPNAFREGRTQRYMPSVRLYLFVSLLFFLFLSSTGLAFMQLNLQADIISFNHDKQGRVIKIENGKSTIVKGLKSDAKGNISTTGDIEIAVPKMKADGRDVTATVTTKPVFFSPLGSVHPNLSPEIKKTLAAIRKDTLAGKEGSGWFMRDVYGMLTKLQTDPAALNGPMTTWIPRILFVLLPLFALLLSAFYRRQRKDFLYVDHLIFSLTMHSFAFVVLICAAVLAQVLSGGWVATLTVIVLSVYFLLSLKRFYGQNWWMTGLKFAGIAFIYPTFFLTPALTAALIASAAS